VINLPVPITTTKIRIVVIAWTTRPALNVDFMRECIHEVTIGGTENLGMDGSTINRDDDFECDVTQFITCDWDINPKDIAMNGYILGAKYFFGEGEEYEYVIQFNTCCAVERIFSLRDSSTLDYDRYR
jgi:hypothetical protein